MSLIDELKNDKTGLDEREQYFLDILFDECGGDFKLAMKNSGYPASHPVGELRRKLSTQIKRATKDYIVSQTPKAAITVVSVLDNPNDTVGIRNVLTAAKEILDRGDVNKEEQKFDVAENVVVLLPAKKITEEE